MKLEHFNCKSPMGHADKAGTSLGQPFLLCSCSILWCLFSSAIVEKDIIRLSMSTTKRVAQVVPFQNKIKLDKIICGITFEQSDFTKKNLYFQLCNVGKYLFWNWYLTIFWFTYFQIQVIYFQIFLKNYILR